jgi:hypothetical protein
MSQNKFLKEARLLLERHLLKEKKTLKPRAKQLLFNNQLRRMKRTRESYLNLRTM